eukprot:gnl/TRDRNA2_/TRDRNA2_160194_c0_seq2.p1 gnl/TRDRNA2_/TRDRNA2_160194_c0~~gnl/TRDRNA2_/TRDRNA2_160194_c0_seq2.p1  ORF type:complete len:343 (-),score=42.93 gnl/TRDRNA2_/TRDRNA2_160194_c0_seq2:352-1380(-)
MMVCNPNEAADAFFARLPENQLDKEEAELLSLLQQVALKVQSLLPRSVTLQTWAQRRIPQGLARDVNDTGLVYVPPAGKGSTPTPPLFPPRAKLTQQTDAGAPVGTSTGQTSTAKLSKSTSAPVEVRGRAVCAKDYHADFLNSLPLESYLPWESELREAILSYRESHFRGIPLERLENSGRLHNAIQSLNDAHVPLSDWISARMGAEVHVDEKEGVGAFMTFVPEDETAKEERRKSMELYRDQFLADLPSNALTPDEEALRHALHDFLSGWKAELPPTLTQACMDRNVAHAKRTLLPAEVSLNMWCEARLGDEIEMMRTHNNQLAFGFAAIETQQTCTCMVE